MIVGLLTVVTGQGFGQEGSVGGIVRDSATSNPLPGANIVLEGSRKGAATDYRGYYKLDGLAPGTYTMTVSHVGYKILSRTIDITNSMTETMDFFLSEQPYMASEAVITGTRYEVLRKTTPMSVSMVSREEIEQSGETNILPVLSSRTPGMFVTERGITGYGVSAGSAGRISIRGVGGSPNSRVLVLIDGQPQFMGIFGHPLPDSYLASDAEKAEVVRGPASVLYGSNAMGGVVNIITRGKQTDGLSLEANGGYGSWNSYKASANAGYKIKRWSVFASGNKEHTDGHRLNSAFDILNGYLKTSYDLTPRLRVTADVSLAGFDATDPGPVNTTDTTYVSNPHWQDILRGYTSVSLENSHNRTEGAVTVHYNWGDHNLYDGFHSRDRNLGVSAYQGLRLFAGNQVTIGADFAQYGGMAENLLLSSSPVFVDTTVWEGGVYAVAQQTFFNRLLVTGGLRAHYHELFGMQWVPQAGASYAFATRTTCKVNVSKGFRSPTIQELFLFKPANPDLLPEEMWNYEASIAQAFLDHRLVLELTGFYSSGSNMIETTGMPPDISNRNVGSFQNHGLEFSGRFLAAEGLDLYCQYSWLSMNKVVVAAPKHHLFAETAYNWKWFRFNLSGEYVNGLYTRAEPAVIESYFLLNASVYYSLKKFLSFYLTGQNLLDQAYEINYGYPMPGLSVMGGIKFKFETK